MSFSGRRHRRPRGAIGFTLSIAVVVFVASSSSSSPSPSSSSTLVEATKVTWKGNEDVPPEHEAAHAAPRSQRYWDEHGIKRPDYAKTDAEIAAERRGGRGGEGMGGMMIIVRAGLVLFFLLLLLAAMMIVVVRSDDYATGRRDGIILNGILNHPAGARVVRCAKWIMGSAVAGGGGNKLGSSSSSSSATNGADGVSEEESRRLARLARFDNPRDMLDNMKMD